MSQQTERLKRLLTDELGECCDDDVKDRLASLQAHRSELPAHPESDLTALSTLGSETRYTIVRLLNATDREMCVCEINPIVDVSNSAISHALSDLFDAGLVTRRKEGNWRYYDVSDRAEALLVALDDSRGDA